MPREGELPGSHVTLVAETGLGPGNLPAALRLPSPL